VFRADLLALRAGTIAVGINCQMADLTDDALVGYRYRRDEVIDSPVDEYTITRRWGQHAWRTTGYAGLVWNSRRGPERLSFMLFVDPPRAADRQRALSRRPHLEVVSPPIPLYDDDGFAAVMAVAAERNVTVIV
jgi:hypothetical protein